MTADGKSVFNTKFLPRNALGSNPLDKAKYMSMLVKSYVGTHQPAFRLQDGKPEYRKTLRDGTTSFWHDVRELIQKKEAFYMDVVVNIDSIPYGNGPSAQVPSVHNAYLKEITPVQISDIAARLEPSAFKRALIIKDYHLSERHRDVFPLGIWYCPTTAFSNATVARVFAAQISGYVTT